MPRRAVMARISWEDRFYTPTLGQLLGGLSREHAALINHARKSLRAVAPGPETISWQGIPWRWTLLLWGDCTDRPWAYIVPQPGSPHVALPLDVDHLALLPRRLSRYVRDGLASAPQVGNICWAQWELQTPAQTDELIAIARIRFDQSLAPVA